MVVFERNFSFNFDEKFSFLSFADNVRVVGDHIYTSVIIIIIIIIIVVAVVTSFLGQWCKIES